MSRTTVGNSRFQQFLDDGLFSERAEVADFDRRGLFEEGICLGLGRNECGSLFRILRNDVAANRSAFVQNEPIVVLVKV